MICKKVKIKVKFGHHLRPATKFAAIVNDLLRMLPSNITERLLKGKAPLVYFAKKPKKVET